MRSFLLAAVVMITCNTTAQNYTVQNIIEGGRTLVELIKVFKTPRPILHQQTLNPQQAPISQQVQTSQQTLTLPQSLAPRIDSCSVKNVSDLSFKNSTVKGLYVSLYRRNGNSYETNVLTMKVLPKAIETLFEIKSGIYKFKIEVDGEDDEKIVYQEGEMKLNACENLVKEIKDE